MPFDFVMESVEGALTFYNSSSWSSLSFFISLSLSLSFSHFFAFFAFISQVFLRKLVKYKRFTQVFLGAEGERKFGQVKLKKRDSRHIHIPKFNLATPTNGIQLLNGNVNVHQVMHKIHRCKWIESWKHELVCAKCKNCPKCHLSILMLMLFPRHIKYTTQCWPAKKQLQVHLPLDAFIVLPESIEKCEYLINTPTLFGCASMWPFARETLLSGQCKSK